jgi:hypothetical protein
MGSNNVGAICRLGQARLRKRADCCLYNYDKNIVAGFIFPRIIATVSLDCGGCGFSESGPIHE